MSTPNNLIQPRVGRFPDAVDVRGLTPGEIPHPEFADSPDELSLLSMGSDEQAGMVLRGIGYSPAAAVSWKYDPQQDKFSRGKVAAVETPEQAGKKINQWIKRQGPEAVVYATARSEWGAQAFSCLSREHIGRMKGLQAVGSLVYTELSAIAVDFILELLQVSDIAEPVFEQLYGIKTDRVLVYNSPELQKLGGQNCAVEHGVEAVDCPRLQDVWVDGPAGEAQPLALVYIENFERCKMSSAELGDILFNTPETKIYRVPFGEYEFVLTYTDEKQRTIHIAVNGFDPVYVGIYYNDAPTDLPGYIEVTGGNFLMGSRYGDGYRDEDPQQKVTLSDYRITPTQVTFAMYDVYCDATGAKKPDDEDWGRGERPAININWYDAVRYANWLSEQQGLEPAYSIDGEEVSWNRRANGWRLPTEAEWEYAARGGQQSQGFRYSGSNTADEVAWYADNSRRKTHPVGRKKHNELGLYDMSGNVYEWCWDWYGNYSSEPQTDPTGPASGSCRVIRGGSWYGDESDARSADRNYSNMSYRSIRHGFRLLCRQAFL